MLYARHLAHFTCADCQRYVFDISTGEQAFHEQGDGEKVPSLRNGVEPPCRLGQKCPRGSPDREHETSLTERSWCLWKAYQELRAAGPDPRNPPDDFRRWAFALIDSVVRPFETRQTAVEIARVMAGGG